MAYQNDEWPEIVKFSRFPKDKPPKFIKIMRHDGKVFLSMEELAPKDSGGEVKKVTTVLSNQEMAYLGLILTRESKTDE